jgi:hypothetical protein
MSTTKVSSMPELTQQLEVLEQEAEEKVKEVRRLYAIISKFAQDQSENFHIGDGESTNGSVKVTRKKRVKKTEDAPMEETPTTTKSSDESMSLKEAIQYILSKKSMWKEHLGEDFPRGAQGLTAGEIRTIINATGIWSSPSKSANSQIYTAVNNLLQNKDLKRKERRYSVK